MDLLPVGDVDSHVVGEDGLQRVILIRREAESRRK